MCAAGMSDVGGMRSSLLRAPVDRDLFPPLTRVQIEQLACCDPAGIGLEMTHWSTRSLAKAAVAQKIVSKIAHSTVSLILRAADLQPHRYRYWKTPRLDATFVQRAAQVLWCYEQVDQLRSRGEYVICFDEKPNLQALERRVAKQPMRPGRRERQEFEYLRHGTVNFAVALMVADGQMRGWCLDKNDSEHLAPVLEELFRDLSDLRRIHLLWDGGSSHVSQSTQNLLHAYRKRVRVLVTPPHASWLNQAELLLRAFTHRYLQRGDWRSRQQLVCHLDSAWREYNRLFAQPFNWSWTRRDMRKWVQRNTHSFSQKTCHTVH